MTDVPTLCAQLAVLRRALAAATTPGRLSDRATPHMTVAATLTPTAPPAAGGRRVPGSRPPVSLIPIDTARQFDQTVQQLAADMRTLLGHETVDTTPAAALNAIQAHWELIPDMSALTRTIPDALAELSAISRRVLGIGRRWMVFGECPADRQHYTATWQPDGIDPAADWTDGICRTYNVLASTHASRHGRPVDIWRRSRLRVDQDADPQSRDGEVHCPGCGARWPGRQWLQLGTVLDDTRERIGA